MIQKLEINGVHTVLTEDLKKYITAKIGKLDRYLPKHARESAHVEIYVKEKMIKAKKECHCEVVLHLPGANIRVAEDTINMFAAIDIVEHKLRNRIKKYKELHTSLKLHRRVIARFRREPIPVHENVFET